MPTNYYSNSFQSDVTTVLRTAVQQEGSFLEKTVTKASYKGTAAQVADFVKKAPTPFQNRSSKSDTQYSDIDTVRRWIYGVSQEEAILIDQYDKLRTLNDPSGMYTKVMRDAMGRARDEIINAAFFADAKTGTTGSGTTSFDSGNVVAVTVGASAATGMNLAKITAAKQRLMYNHVDVQREQLWMAVNSKIWADLVNDPEVNNKMNGGLLDYKTGQVANIFGINIVMYEDLDVDGSGYIRVPVYTQSALQLGIWKDITAVITPQVAVKRNATQIYVDQMIGATRLEEEKIVEIKVTAS